MQPLPNQISPFVSKVGRILAPWVQYLQQFTQAPPNVIDITIGPSPFFFEAQEPGIVTIEGGTISATVLSRGLIQANLTGERIFPVAIKDRVSIIYSVIPTMKFWPSYGQNTGS